MRWTFAPLAAVLAIAGLVRCNSQSPPRNLLEQPAVFSTMGPETQDELRHGIIREGETPGLVSLALGQPDRVEQAGNATKWSYSGSVLAPNLDPIPVQDVIFENGRIVAIHYTEARDKSFSPLSDRAVTGALPPVPPRSPSQRSLIPPVNF
jgi:hypothetical protein